MRSRSWDLAAPLDLATTLGVHRRGRADPAFAVVPTPRGQQQVWRCVRTPNGAASARVSVDGRQVSIAAAGPGADWVLERGPDWVGEHDRPADFQAQHEVLRTTHRHHRGWRVGASGLLLDALVPAVLEQKVTGGESRRAWRWLLGRHGEPAPDPAPAGMRVLPEAAAILAIPSWEWHRAGVGPQRAATLVRVCRVAARLQEGLELGADVAERRMRSVAGVGVWTVAEALQRAAGALDVVSVGDAHLPRVVVHALTGQISDDDAVMLELMEPYRPERYRVQRLVELAELSTPRFGPRYAPLDHRTR